MADIHEAKAKTYPEFKNAIVKSGTSILLEATINPFGGGGGAITPANAKNTKYSYILKNNWKNRFCEHLISLISNLTENSTSDIESQEEVETFISELNNISDDEADDIIGIESPKPIKSKIKGSNLIKHIADYFHRKCEDCKRKLSSPPEFISFIASVCYPWYSST